MARAIKGTGRELPELQYERVTQYVEQAADRLAQRSTTMRMTLPFDRSATVLAYAASEAAINVAPGPVTPLIPSTMPQKRVRTCGADTVFDRVAQPVETAPLFVFLASNEARFVTGEVYGAISGQTPC